MNPHLKTIFRTAAICAIGCLSSVHAEDTKFGDWTVSVNPAPTSIAENAGEVKRETIIREIHEVRHVRNECSGPRYHGYRKNYSIYFPWRNYGNYGFSSYYRPQTIYNYGYGR